MPETTMNEEALKKVGVLDSYRRRVESLTDAFYWTCLDDLDRSDRRHIRECISERIRVVNGKRKEAQEEYVAAAEKGLR